MRRLLNLSIVSLGWVAVLTCGFAFAQPAEQTSTDADEVSAAEQAQLAYYLAGTQLGGTVFATAHPDYAATLVLLIRDVADDAELDDSELDDLMLSADELCAKTELRCRQLKRAVRRDARSHAKSVKRRVAQWTADGTLPSEPEPAEIRERVREDRERVAEEELVVTAPRLKDPYFRKPAPEVYRALNSQRLGIWHYNKAATHERAARRHVEYDRPERAEESLASARAEFKIAFPYLLVAAQQGLKWPAAMVGYLYLSGKAGDLTPRDAASAEAAIGWLGLAATGSSTREMKSYYEQVLENLPEELLAQVDEIVLDYDARWGPRAQGTVCRHATNTHSRIKRFRCYFPNVSGRDPFLWDDPIGLGGIPGVPTAAPGN